MATPTANQLKAEQIAMKVLDICQPIAPIMFLVKRIRDDRVVRIKQIADQIVTTLDRGIDVTVEDLLYSSDETCRGGEGPPPE
jgi:hypothetical protein